MGGSKNNPNNRNRGVVVERTCDLCGTTGPINTSVKRIMKGSGGKNKMIWKCKEGCK